MFPAVAEQLALIMEGVAEVITEAELTSQLDRSRRTGKPLVVKQGFDPTRPDLHIGHAVSIGRLRAFQDLGHRVVFLIGDFTARVGDPSGQNDTRPMLTAAEIERNLQTYKAQVFRILDPERTEFRRNSEWLAPLGLEEVLRLTSQYTVARMLERDDFKRRYADERPISLVEFLYPMMQAYDSVCLKADVELGGSDQKFNLLLGRTFQERAGQEPQVCITVPILRGTDGQRKMSKSYDNYVGVAMEPSEMFGRTLSIPDTLLTEWIELASGAPAKQRAAWKERSASEPLAAKRWLAAALVERYHDRTAAEAARSEFDRVHREHELPTELPMADLSVGADGTLWIAHALVGTGLTSSTSDALRMIRQSAVRVDGSVVLDRDLSLSPGVYVLQRGKRRYVRLRLSAGGESAG